MDSTFFNIVLEFYSITNYSRFTPLTQPGIHNKLENEHIKHNGTNASHIKAQNSTTFSLFTSIATADLTLMHSTNSGSLSFKLASAAQFIVRGSLSLAPFCCTAHLNKAQDQ